YLLEFGSIFILRAEVGAPGATITTADNAFWWVLVTISTVGYGDLVPVTNQGRFVAAFVIVAGVGVFGTLSGYLANSFLGQSSARRETKVKEMADPILEEFSRLYTYQESARKAQEEENRQLLARMETLEKLLHEMLAD
ncbi:MAG: potassium channel family protein, partial [Candidatus Promineifilaceae bacterium]|nr:potassium channel family protein [Candidatus Promineifilaceae bacterium]